MDQSVQIRPYEGAPEASGTPFVLGFLKIDSKLKENGGSLCVPAAVARRGAKVVYFDTAQYGVETQFSADLGFDTHFALPSKRTHPANSVISWTL